MKAIARIIVLVILSMFVFYNGMAQKASYTTNSGMTIGFGLGGSYQKSDLLNSRGGGFDFTLGSHLYKKENAFFSVDWKFRFLAGENRAFDHRINPDTTYGNIQHRFFSYDLELGLTLNRLRERTRIIVTGFAGAGITHGITHTDLYDAGNNFYDFSVIDPNRDSKLVHGDLVALSDGNFETQLINRAAILPTAGFFVGYQFSRSFSLGIEFKTNFYLTENNSVTGYDLDNRITDGSTIDRNNYVGLGFKWNLRGGSSSGYPVSDSRVHTEPVPIPTETLPTESRITEAPVYLPQPAVHIFDPSADPFRTASSTHTIKATIRNVSGSGGIRFYQNGNPNNNFSYNATLKSFSADVQLRNGENTFRIEAANQSSTAEDQVIIIHDESIATAEPEAVAAPSPAPEIEISAVNETVSDAEDQVFIQEARPCPPPLIKLIAPAQEQSNSNQQTYEIWAEVLNVSGSSQIRLNVNGRPVTFNFNNNLVTKTVPLNNGINTLSLSALNECGDDRVSARITYSPSVAVVPPCIPPKVSITVNEVNRDDASHELRGSVSNIKDKADISFMVDGSASDGFRFDQATGELNAELKLTPGLHTVIISVRNDCGTDNMGVNVNMKEPCLPPRLSFTVTEVSRDDASHEFRGMVFGVKNRSGISLTVDGRADNTFRFDPATGDLNGSLKLTPGSHTIVVSVTNACGSDKQDVVVIMEAPCIPPKVSFTVNEVDRNDASHELRGSVSNVDYKAGISLNVNGSADDGFRFDPATGDLGAFLKLAPGTHHIDVSVTNACGSDYQGISVSIEEPCLPPRVSITVNEVNRDDASHELRGMVFGVEDRSGISLKVDGKAVDGFRFDPATGDLSAELKLSPGPHSISISATTACGSDNQGLNINIEEPCVPPRISFTLNEVNRDDASHELRGSVSNVKERAGISLTVNGSSDDGFRFVPASGDLNAKFKLAPGSHTIVVSVTNACGADKQDVSIIIEEPCIPPRVTFTLNEVSRDDASHELSGSVSNVEDRAGISLTVNGRADDGFRFDPASGDLNARFKLTPGSHTIVVSVTNACGTDNQDVSVIIEEPCIPPRVSFTINETDLDDASHELIGSISNVKNRADIALTINGSTEDGFRFVPETGDLTAKFNLAPGSHAIVVSVTNACGSDRQDVNVIMEEPCIPPKVSFTITEVDRNDASHELNGSISNVKNKADVTLTVNGNAEDGFQFVPATGDLDAKFKLTPGTHMIVVSVTNACGTDNQGVSVIIEEQACGVRINPGNSSWQFCLVTPSGTFNRDNLTDESFSYSGPASSIYFQPIGGGGDVMVNGSSYSIKSGQYYLFDGNLEVTVSTQNPGSMGHWSVCISSDTEPVSGNGNNRPESPCNEDDDDDYDDDKKGKGKGNE